jgi:hypothetical protein
MIRKKPLCSGVLSHTVRLPFLVSALLFVFLPAGVSSLTRYEQLSMKRIAPYYGYYKPVPVYSGERSVQKFILENVGNSEITDILLSVSVPPGWEASVDPDKIESLGPGGTAVVEVVIIPPKTFFKTDVQLHLEARTGFIEKLMPIRISFRSPRGMWAIVGSAFGCAVIALFVFIFLRLNKDQKQ